MRLRNWLLTGTSMTMLAFAPVAAQAQEELPQACIDAGFTTLEDCIAAQPAEGEEAVPEAPAEDEVVPDEEPAPEVIEEEPVPEDVAPEVIEEEPAPEPEVIEEEPAPEPEVIEEEPAPEPEVIEEEPLPEVDEAPVPEVEEEPLPDEEVVPEEEPAPEVIEDEAPQDEPVLENPEIPEEFLTPEEDADSVEDDAPVVDEAPADEPVIDDSEIAPEAPAEEVIEDGVPAENAEGEPVLDVPVEDLPTEPIEDLPEGVTEEQIAPVLDSAKDEEVVVDGEEVVQEPVIEETEEPATPPPSSDEEAQATFEVEEAQAISATQEEGQRVEASAIQPLEVPQNVTIVNQTNVTNNVTNNNTTVNNTTNNTTNNIGEQTNIEVDASNTYYGGALTQVILEIGNQLIVRTPGQDTSRFYNPDSDEIYYEDLGNGRVREVITRADGSQIVTVRNRNGDVLRRSRITPDGREYVLAYFDDRYDDQLLEWRDPGLDLPPLRLTIPVDEYVLDAEYADEDELETFFRQPPVERVARLYSVDEVKRSARVRDSVRKLEVGGLTFDTGAATIGRDQVDRLSRVANAMLTLLETNPAETFLIEGHTDAVGSDQSNLSLSDLRAATVARILTDFYGVPAENLATQGYGERYLKIRTEAAERENRRVTIRRITPLVTVASAS